MSTRKDERRLEVRGRWLRWSIALVGLCGCSPAGGGGGPAEVGTTTRALSVSEGALLLPAYVPSRFDIHGFGNRIAVDGDWAAIGRRNATIDNSRAVNVMRNVGGTWNTWTLLESPDDDSFGDGLAIDGDTLVVGAPASAGHGAAYVYRRTADSWALEQLVEPDEPEAGAEFGVSVAVEGDTLVVGAAEFDGASSNEGAAYVFQRAGSTWTQVALLRPSDPYPASVFGYSVAISQGQIAVAAPSHRAHDFSRSGSVYVFEPAQDGWTEVAELMPSGADDYTDFGFVIALQDAELVVGAAGDGAAYVFTSDDSVWSQSQKLTDATQLPNYFALLSLAGDRLVAGTPEAVVIYERQSTNWVAMATVALDDGRYVAMESDGDHFLVGISGELNRVRRFSRAGGSWHPAERLLPADPDIGPGDAFGSGVALGQGLLLVGAPGKDAENVAGDGTDRGAAYLWQREGSGWTALGRLQGGFNPGAHAGVSVAIPDDERVYVGIPGSDYTIEDGGAVFAYTLGPYGWQYQAPRGGGGELGASMDAVEGLVVAGEPSGGLGGGRIVIIRAPLWNGGESLMPDGLIPGDGYGRAVATDGARVAGGAPGRDTSATDAGAVFVTAVTSDVGAIEVVDPDGQEGDRFGAAVDLLDTRLLVGAPGRGSEDSGAAYLFTHSNLQWELEATLQAPDSTPLASFGAAVGIAGDTVAIAAPGVGTVYLYRFIGDSWQLIDEIAYSGGGNQPGFGSSLDFEGDQLVVGASGDDWHADGGGTAFVYEVSGDPIGAPCEEDGHCASGFCVDGVCCDSACGGGDTGDCQACSVAAGSSEDGLCEENLATCEVDTEPDAGLDSPDSDDEDGSSGGGSGADSDSSSGCQVASPGSGAGWLVVALLFWVRRRRSERRVRGPR